MRITASENVSKIREYGDDDDFISSEFDWDLMNCEELFPGVDQLDDFSSLSPWDEFTDINDNKISDVSMFSDVFFPQINPLDINDEEHLPIDNHFNNEEEHLPLVDNSSESESTSSSSSTHQANLSHIQLDHDYYYTTPHKSDETTKRKRGRPCKNQKNGVNKGNRRTTTTRKGKKIDRIEQNNYLVEQEVEESSEGLNVSDSMSDSSSDIDVASYEYAISSERTVRKSRNCFSPSLSEQNDYNSNRNLDDNMILQKLKMRSPKRKVEKPQTKRSRGRTGRPTVPGARSNEKRESHNLMERRRRVNMKFKFDYLKELTPDIRSKERAPKIMILLKATDYITKLRNQAHSAELTLHQNRCEQSRFKATLTRLRTQIFDLKQTIGIEEACLFEESFVERN